MTQDVEALFEQGLERYQAGDSISDLIPLFQEVCDRAPKVGPAFTCLAWLYLLEDRPTAAYKTAQRAVKLNPQDPQARVNLAVALLETGKKGVREHIDMAAQVLAASAELRNETKASIEEGLSRKPDWKSLSRVQQWLFDS
jgi:predicted Zn-dependent protease